MTYNKNIKVSIVIPIYNTESFLKRCLDSVLNQTLKEIEIICIDDASTDNSLNILKQYKKNYDKDNKITIIEQPINKGQEVARNIGLENSQGEWIGFLDSDDYVDLDYFEKLYTATLKSKPNTYLFVGTREKDFTCDVITNSDFVESVNECGANIWRCLFNNSFLDKNKIRFPEFEKKIRGGDGYFILIYLSYLYENKFSFCEISGFNYHKDNTNSNSITNTIRNIDSDSAILLYNQIYENFKNRNLLNQLNFPFSRLLYSLRNLFNKDAFYLKLRDFFLKIEKDSLISWNLYFDFEKIFFSDVLSFTNYSDYINYVNNYVNNNPPKKKVKIKIFKITLFKLTYEHCLDYTKISIYFLFLNILTFKTKLEGVQRNYDFF